MPPVTPPRGTSNTAPNNVGSLTPSGFASNRQQDPETPTRSRGNAPAEHHGHMLQTPAASGSGVGVDSETPAPTGPNNPTVAPSTPPRPSLPVKNITPSIHGTSEQAQARSGHTSVENTRGAIETDIKMPGRRIRVDFMDFLKVLLKRCARSPDTNIDTLLNDLIDNCVTFCNSDEYKEIAQRDLVRYCAGPRNDETYGYEPLATFINGVLEKLETQDGVFDKLKERSKFEPRLVQSKHRIVHRYDILEESNRGAERGPDLLLVTKKLKDSIRDPLKHSFEWPNLLTTLEIKLMCTKGFPIHSGDYDVGKRSPTKHNFLPDGHLSKQDKPLHSASKVFQVEATTTMEQDVPAESELATSSSTGESNTISSTTMDTTVSSSATSSNASNPKKRPTEGEHIPSKRKKPNFGAVRAAQNTKKPPPNAQNAMYACEMLCRGIYSRHSINLVIADDVVWPWWYNRQNAIQGSGLNFVKDAPFFIAFLVLLQRLEASDWGIIPDLAPTSAFLFSSAGLSPAVVDFDNDVQVEIEKLDRKAIRLPGPVLKGRGTTVVAVTSKSVDPGTNESLDKKKLVVKAYWPEDSRPNEAHIIQDARALLERTNIELVRYLPRVIASRDIPSSNTGDIVREFDAEFASADSGERVLRLLLFRRLLPLDKVENEAEFSKAWVDCFTCHYALWKNGFEHGDISIWNLMWDATNKCGTLNDWDLAYVRETEGKGPAKERTGTLPFMARELLEEPGQQRLYRHEVESFIWVITYFCLSTAEVTRWRTGDALSVVSEKTRLMASFMKMDIFDNPSGVCKKVVLLLHLLRTIDDILYNLRLARRRREHRMPDDQCIHDVVLAIMKNEAISVDDVDDFILKV